MSVHTSSRQTPVPRADWVEARTISDTEWRIGDTRIPVGDAGSVLGFAERTDDGHFDVLCLGSSDGVERLTFGTFDDVLAYFSRWSGASESAISS